MQLTAEQAKVVEQALEIAYEAKLQLFEENCKRADIPARQLAVRSYNEAKRFGELLLSLRGEEQTA